MLAHLVQVLEPGAVAGTTRAGAAREGDAAAAPPALVAAVEVTGAPAAGVAVVAVEVSAAGCGARPLFDACRIAAASSTLILLYTC